MISLFLPETNIHTYIIPAGMYVCMVMYNLTHVRGMHQVMYNYYGIF